MKIFSLIKAAFSQDMNMFKYKSKRNSSKAKKIILPIVLFCLICFSISTYAFALAEELKPHNLTYVMLSMFLLITTMIALIEGIYKAQGILFDAKDNDLLFSLPIKKSKILFVRLLKILTFQYLFNLMFLIPAFLAYIRYEAPGVTFYLISILMTFLVPIIPTVIACVLGYIVKLISSKFKKQKLVQTILTSIVFFAVFFVLLNYQNIIGNITENGENISNVISKIYYPIGLYLNLINRFEILDLIKLLLINIIPLILFVIVASKSYFKIIAKSKEHTSKTIKNIDEVERNIKVNSPLVSLIKKELKRYLSCTTYMFNTAFSLLLAVIISVVLCFKGEDIFAQMLSNYNIETGGITLNVIFYIFIIFVGATTSITSSSVSLEGKTINITKSLPVKEKTILNSKILTCFIIEAPFILIADLIFFIRFNPGIIYGSLILLVGFIMILMSACIGLFINLKYPKMDASSDTEVVKQSMSSMISTFLGMGIFIVSSGLVLGLGNIVKMDIAVILTQIILFIIAVTLYAILMKVGPKKYKNINV